MNSSVQLRNRLALRAPITARHLIGLPLVLTCLMVTQSFAQIRVNPSGLNVSTQTPISALLTFGNLNNQKPAEATWCGELIPAAPDLGLKCNPATIFGVIPARYDRTTPSGTRSYTDIMTLPASVARRAYQAGISGSTSSFFFVRRFVSTVGGSDEFVAVTCRMTGGTAGSPFSLTNVRLYFTDTDKPILFVKAGEKLPQLKAEISYSGTGRLKGNWEVVMPGEDPPSANDLLTEATLPIEQRGTQKHYTELSRFNIFLPPDGKYTLPGPDPTSLPVIVAGEYLLLLRIQASETDASISDLAAVGAGPGVVYSGAVAGFPMPVIRYFVGASTGLAPADNVIVAQDGVSDFAWRDVEKGALYRLEITDANGKSILSALFPPGVSTYRAPSWVRNRATSGGMKWRVTVVDDTGKQISESFWRDLRFQKSSANIEPVPSHQKKR